MNVVELGSAGLVVAARIGAFGVSGVNEFSKFSTGFVFCVAEVQYLSGYRIVEESSPLIVCRERSGEFGIEWPVAGQLCRVVTKREERGQVDQQANTYARRAIATQQ